MLILILSVLILSVSKDEKGSPSPFDRLRVRAIPFLW